MMELGAVSEPLEAGLARRRNGDPCPSTWLCPTTSSRVCGRIRTANGLVMSSGASEAPNKSCSLISLTLPRSRRTPGTIAYCAKPPPTPQCCRQPIGAICHVWQYAIVIATVPPEKRRLLRCAATMGTGSNIGKEADMADKDAKKGIAKDSDTERTLNKIENHLDTIRRPKTVSVRLAHVAKVSELLIPAPAVCERYEEIEQASADCAARHGRLRQGRHRPSCIQSGRPDGHPLPRVRRPHRRGEAA